MVRTASNSRVSAVDVEIERPVDRGRKRDVTRTNSATQAISGSGGSGTIKTNNSTANWWVDLVTVSSTGSAASRGVIEVEIQITDSNSNVITSVTGDVHDYPMDLGGHVMKPDWSLDYAISQTDATSYTVKMHPIIRKPEPVTADDDDGGGGGTKTLIDSFEDGGITEYTGDTGSFSVVSTDSVHLDNSLESSTTTADEINSTSGLENYPERGDTFTFWIKTTNLALDAARIGMNFGLVDANNHFQVRMNYGDSKVILQEIDGGTVTVDESSPPASNLSNNQWDKMRVVWDDPVEATILPGGSTDGSATVSEPLSNFNRDSVTNGGIGWFARLTDGTETVRADSAEIV